MVWTDNKYTILYFIVSLLSLFFIDNNSVVELILKLLSLAFLIVLYISKTDKINYWYLTVLLLSMISDASLIFDPHLLLLGSLLLVVNRVLYIIISRRALKETKLKTLLFYLTICLLVFLINYTLVKPYAGELHFIVALFGSTSSIMILFAFLNYLNKMNRKNKYFLFGLFLIVLADVLMAINKFVDYKLLYVISYTVIYYIARYLICDAMIVEKRKS